MLINGSAINTVAVNSYSQLIEYLTAQSYFSYNSAAANSLFTKFVADSSFSWSEDSSATVAILVSGSSQYSVGTGGVSKLVTALQGISDFVYGSSGNSTPATLLSGDSNYSVGEDSRIRVVQYLGQSAAVFAIGTDGKITISVKVAGLSNFGFNSFGRSVVQIRVVGNSNYSVGSSGSSSLTAFLQSVVEYIVSSTGSNRLDTWFSGSTEYQIEDYGRVNVVKYSQEVLEEFACVTYNVEKVGNTFMVTAVENSSRVVPDATIVFEVNRC